MFYRIIRLFVAFCLLTFCCQNISAQIPSNLGFQRDTSFTTNAALVQVKKKYPQASLPKVTNPKTIYSFKNITYKTENGIKLAFDRYFSNTNSASPAVIIVHGGGWKSGNRQQHEELATGLAQAGYQSYTIDYSLSGQAHYPQSVKDVEIFVEFLRLNAKSFNINPEQITILGFSAGGALASLVAAKANGTKKPNALINIDGVLSFLHPDSGEGDDSKGLSAATLWFGVNKETNPAIWNEASALSHVSNMNMPVLFLNSSVKRMQAGQKEFRANLNSRGIYTQVYEFPDSPHTFCLFEPWFSKTLTECISFLNHVFQKN